MESEAGDDQDSDKPYPENEAKCHNPSLRVLRASGLPVLTNLAGRKP